MLEKKYLHYISADKIYPSFFLIAKDYDLWNKKIIDLWASDWRYIEYFWKWSCWVEYSEHDLQLAKNRWLNVVKWDLNIDFSFFNGEQFDFIFSSHVIEHLDSPCLFLKRIRDFWWINAKVILWYPLENSIVRFFDPYFWHDWHIYSFSLNNIKKLLSETWFTLEKIYYDIPFAGRWKFFNWLEKKVQILPYWMVCWWANALYIIAKKI